MFRFSSHFILTTDHYQQQLDSCVISNVAVYHLAASHFVVSHVAASHVAVFSCKPRHFST